MDNTTPDRSNDADLIARVVAWHNRSLLTRRIKPAQVTGIGVVALPFASSETGADNGQPPDDQPPGGRFANAMAGASGILAGLKKRLRIGRKSGPRALFAEQFIPALKLRLIARFASIHGDLSSPGNDEWPLRRIPAAAANSGAVQSARYLRTAAIECGGNRLRVLIGSGPRPAIIGSRFWSRRRLSGLLAGAGLAAITTALLVFWPADSAVNTPADGLPAAPPVATTNTPAPSIEAQAAPPIAPAPQVPMVATAASAALMADATQAVAADRSAPIDPGHAAVEVKVDNKQRHRQSAPLPAAKVVPDDVAAPPVAVNDGAFALAAEPTRSRVSSMLRMALLDMPAEPHEDGIHAEVMQTGTQWRVVIWPYASRQAAEQARSSLRERGIKFELITF